MASRCFQCIMRMFADYNFIVFMTFFSKQEIGQRLELIKDVIFKLRECGKSSKKEFIEDFKISDSAMRNLILGSEIVTDIGNHILTEAFQVHPKEYSEVIILLGETGVVDKKFATENVNMARFRNLLVHEYIKIDLDKVYDYLQKAPEILAKFAKYFVEFIDRANEE